MTAPGIPDRAEAVVIGAGPAGLAAAASAAAGGLRVLLVDSAARTGGQYWRHSARDEAPGAPAPRWHHGWSRYRRLAQAVSAAEGAGLVTRLASTQVLSIDPCAPLDDAAASTASGLPGLELSLTRVPEAGGGPVVTCRADRVILCPGAYDRQVPVPGWTLPGVMAAGGIQAFIKVQQTLPGSRVVIGGTGPFLLAAAASVIEAGGTVAAVCESSDLCGWVPGGALGALVPSKAREGAEYATLLARHRVPYRRRTVISRILPGPEGRVGSVVISRIEADGTLVPGTEHHLEDVDLVGLGWGFVPQAELALEAGARMRVDVDDSLVAVVDARGRTSVPGLYAAGEITGVTGSIGAVAEGAIAGTMAAGGQPRWRDLAARDRHQAFARVMHRAHPVPEQWPTWLAEDTVICRCEEVTAGQVASAIEDLSLTDPRSLKGSTRTGMGMCQGRICGASARCLTRQAATADAVLTDAMAAGKRPLTMPITLGSLAHPDGEQPPTI